MHIGIGTMALVFIVPVDDKYRSAGRDPEIKPLRPKVVCINEISSMACRISRSRTFRDIHIYTESIDVVHENGITIDIPMLVTQVKHSTRMRMTTAGCSRTEVT